MLSSLTATRDHLRHPLYSLTNLFIDECDVTPSSSSSLYSYFTSNTSVKNLRVFFIDPHRRHPQREEGFQQLFEALAPQLVTLRTDILLCVIPSLLRGKNLSALFVGIRCDLIAILNILLSKMHQLEWGPDWDVKSLAEIIWAARVLASVSALESLEMRHLIRRRFERICDTRGIDCFLKRGTRVEFQVQNPRLWEV